MELKLSTTTLSQSGPGSNDNERVLHTPQSSRNGASLSDTVECHTEDTSFSFFEGYSQYFKPQLTGC